MDPRAVPTKSRSSLFAGWKRYRPSPRKRIPISKHNEREDNMRSPAIAVSLLTVVVVGLALPSQLAAQEWSAEQQEVWETVQTYLDFANKGDAEGFMSYFHEDFLGWDRSQLVPTNKADRWLMVEHNLATRRAVWRILKPVAIKIHGDVAIAYYYQILTLRYAEGEVRTGQSQWMDILMKQGDKWVLIGDAGGAVSEN
jgi:ketosteroid isomerase-like protein